LTFRSRVGRRDGLPPRGRRVVVAGPEAGALGAGVVAG
jgi:hypothetical protein